MTDPAPRWGATDLAVAFLVALLASGLGLALFAAVQGELSVLAHRTGRLGPSIWAHVGFNATTVVALVAGG